MILLSLLMHHSPLIKMMEWDIPNGSEIIQLFHISKDSTEAEIVASDNHTFVMNTFDLLKELRTNISPPIIYQDNTAVINKAIGKDNKARTKDDRARINIVKESVTNNQLVIEYISTNRMIADLLTKPLPAPIFLSHVDFILNSR